MPSPIEMRLRNVQRQAQVIQSFLTQPRGVFETVDALIKNFRAANQAMLRQLGAGKMGGQLLAGQRGRIVQEVLRKFRRY